MKTLLLSALVLAVAAAPVLGEDQDQPKQPKPRSQPAAKAPPQRQVNRQPNNFPRSYTPRVQQQLNARTQAVLQNKPNVNRTYTPKRDVPNASTNQYWRNRNRTNSNVLTNQTPNANVQTNTNANVRNRNWQNRTNTNRTDTNRNWRNNNNTANTFTFEQARQRHHRERHDRSWWRSRYNRIVLFGGGYYFWDNGYWYPAYGYDPYYSSYAYDEPIYGYNDLDPGQVIANVQSALQEQGYYNDAIDGLIGPNTRAAISNFQRDHGLAITAAIDGPTLKALGLY
jgi:Putative peptidoglycan binding domain